MISFLLGIYFVCGLIIWLIVITQEQRSNTTLWEYVKQFFTIVLFYPFIAFTAKRYIK